MRPIGITSTLVLVALKLSASTVYIGTSSGEFGTLNTLTGVFTQIKASGIGFNGIAFDSLGNLDAIDLGASPNVGFYRVNVSTGALTFVADSTNTNGIAALTSSSSGTLYMTDRANLYTINPVSAAATLIGADGIPNPSLWNIGFGPDGILYGTYNSTLYRFNLATGVGTSIGSTGTSLTEIFAGDGVLYGTVGANLYAVNTGTGAATLTRAITGPLIGQIFGAAPAPAATVPEPETLFLAGSGLLLVAGMRRRFYR